MRATLTTIGLYNYDPTLFDLLTLPAGASKETAINTILLEYGEMTVIYSDPDFYKFAIGKYSETMQEPMKRYWDVLHVQYNPLENYDRQESYTESGTASREKESEKEDELTGTRTTSGTHGLSGTDARTTGGTDRQQGSRTETPNLTDTTSNPPYNTETMTARETQTHTGTVGTSDDYTTTSSGTDNLTLQRSETDSGSESTGQTVSSTGTDSETETRSETRTGRIHGNIGVTTSQQMLLSELEVVERNFYRWLAADFAARFMVLIY